MKYFPVFACTCRYIWRWHLCISSGFVFEKSLLFLDWAITMAKISFHVIYLTFFGSHCRDAEEPQLAEFKIAARPPLHYMSFDEAAEWYLIEMFYITVRLLICRHTRVVQTTLRVLVIYTWLLVISQTWLRWFSKDCHTCAFSPVIYPKYCCEIN